MTWRDAHEEAMFAAADAHDELQLDTSQRIDVFASIEGLGLELLFRPLRRASGLYVPGPNRNDGGILISSLHRLARQRFTAAHELGHFWLEHEASLDVITEVLARSDLDRLAPNEMVAEAFGAWFLMPPELVDVALEGLGVSKPQSPDDVYALSLRLGTSYQATAYHLPNLKLASYDTARAWALQPPKRIKLALAMGTEMTTFHRDVWSLSERDANAAFHVRAGDRFVVTLLEIPSSGFMWSADDLPTAATVIADTLTDALDLGDIQLALDQDQPPGAEQPRTLVLDIDDGASGSVDLSLVKAPVWAPEDTVERFDVHLQVQQPLLGRPVLV